MVILCTIDLETREVSLPAGQVIASYDHNVDVIRFQAEAIPGFSLDTSSIKIAAQGPNKARHDYSVDPSTVSIEEETGYITFDWPIPQGVTEMPIGTFKYGDRGQLIFAVCAEIIDGSTVSKAWHSDDGIITVVAHLEPESGGGEDPSETATNAQKIAQLQTDVAVINTQVGALANGSPTPVETIAEMTDESAVYLYTGSETGYTAGNWYYYNGSAWISGGTYGGAVTSTTFNQHGVPADDFATGQALADKADSADVTALDTRVTAVEGTLSDIKPSVYKPAISSNYGSTLNNYYRVLDTEPSTSKSYAVKITCSTSGNHTFQIGIAGSASSMRDTLGTFNMSANVPIMIYGYTPSGTGHKYVRNTAGDEWDVKFCDVYEDLADDAVNAFAEVSNLNTSVNVLNGKFTQSIGKNRFSGQNLSVGYYNSSGAIVENDAWTLSDYTDIEGFDDVVFSSLSNGARVLSTLSYITFFDSEKVFIEQINMATSAEVPESAKYMRFSWRSAPVDLQVEEGTIYTQYESYTEYNEIVNSPYLKEVVKPYSEIRWAVFGDSMTEKNSKATFSYYDYVHEDLGCSIVNYGASGTGYKAREAEELAFYQRMLTVNPDDFDVLTIFGSVNDAGQTIGNITDTGTTTLCGCINTTIDNFYSVAPFKTIGLVTPPPTRSLNYTAEDTTWIDAYVDAIIGIAKRRSIPVMDMYHESGLRPYNEAFKVEYYNENGSQDVGVHPNSKAHKQFLYPKFRQFFEKLV